MGSWLSTGTFGTIEYCDDGNTVSGDGCAEDCQAEPFYTCRGVGAGSCKKTPGIWAQEAFVKEPRGSEIAGFGEQIAISGDGQTLVIGGNAIAKSYVTILTKTASGWVYQAQLDAPAGRPGYLFGRTPSALSYDGNTLVVGASADPSASPGVNGSESDTSERNAGAAYVFVRTAGSWTKQAYLKASLPEADDYFGTTAVISADGNTIAVGAPQEDGSGTTVDSAFDDNESTNSGAVYTFTRSGSTWSARNYIKNPVSQIEGRFGGDGLALSADGSTLAVGLPDVAGPRGPVGGKVVVFSRTPTAWAAQATLLASNANTDDQFGTSVASSTDGNTLVIGAPSEGSTSAAPSNNSAPYAGAAYVFTRSGAVWNQVAYLKAPDPDEDDYFGNRVAIAGGTIAVGLRGDDAMQCGPGASFTNNDESAGSGAVVTFALQGGTWSQELFIKASNVRYGDEFGDVVAMSSDARTIVASAQYQGAYSTGINGDQRELRDRRVSPQSYSAGAVYIFSR